MNGLFGYGWIDTLVKLILYVLIGAIVLLFQVYHKNDRKEDKTEGD
jgi:hypothetical protein